MKLFQIVLLFSLAVFSNEAFAENKLKNFFKKLEDGVKKELRQRIQPRSDANPQQTEPGIDISHLKREMPGNCSVYEGGKTLDSDPCSRTYFCESGRCYHAYQWPSGARTIVELNRSGNPVRINGSRLILKRNDAYMCVDSTLTGRTFCFQAKPKRTVQNQLQPTKPEPNTNGQKTAEPVKPVKPKTKPKIFSQVLPRYGPLPNAGMYYYSGRHVCHGTLRYLHARVEITNRKGVGVLFSYREIDDDGVASGFHEKAFKGWSIWADGRKPVINFNLRNDPKKAVARGGFKDRGRILAADWLELDAEGRYACEEFQLTKVAHPSGIYGEAEALLKLENPTEADAKKLVELEAIRPPQRWLGKNPRYVSERNLWYGDGYERFWTRYLNHGSLRLQAGFSRSLDDPELVHKLIARLGKLPVKWSGNAQSVFVSQYQLVERYSDLQFEAGLPVTAFKDAREPDACLRMSQDFSGEDELELGQRFGNPTRHWSKRSQREFRGMIQFCQHKHPRLRASLNKTRKLFDDHADKITQRRDNTQWLVSQASKVTDRPVTAEMFLQEGGFALSDSELAKRQIDRNLYERVYLARTASVRSDMRREVDSMIEKHFSSKTYETLWPSKARDECRGPLLNLNGGSMPKGVKGIFWGCLKSADAYAAKTSKEEAGIQAERILALKPDYRNLKETNWFSMDSTRFERLPKSELEAVKTEFRVQVESHFQEALAHAGLEIRTLYGKVEPFTPEEDRLLNMCWADKNLPEMLKFICEEEEKVFAPYREEVRCERALVRFDASDGMLAEYLVIDGQKNKAITFRDFACKAARNRPDLFAQLVGGGVKFWEARRIEVKDKKDKIVYVLELEERSLRDDRGFIRHMWDIASGENDQRIDTMWYGRKVTTTTFAGAEYKSASRSLGCLYRLTSCE